MRILKTLALSATFVVAMSSLALAGDCDKSAETAKAKSDCSKTEMTQTAAAKAEGSCGSSATTAAVKTAGAKGDCSSSAAAKTAKTAKAEGACSSSATTAAVKTAGAKGDCSSSAAVKTAGAKGGCDSKASAVKTAGAEGGCSSSASAVKTAGAKGACGTSGAAVQTAGASCAEKANVAKAIKVETVRMPSGSMAVFYHGTNAEAVAYLQASAEKGCSGFACEIAKGMSSDENCKVEMAKTDNGVMMLVTSEKAEVLDQYAAQYATVMASADAQGDE